MQTKYKPLNKHNTYKFKRQLTRHKAFVRGMFLASIAGLILFSFYSLFRPIIHFATKLASGPSTAFSLVKDPEGVLKSTRGRTNILILGMGGENHEGSQLTDTSIVISVNLLSADTVILSIPRDIWINSLKTKINAVYYYGEQKQTNGGLILSKAAIEEVVGQPIHYAVAIDFDGFLKAIDLVGGVEVDVKTGFDDYRYPVPGMETAEPESLRYEHFHVDAGRQIMNGDFALKYVRSRNAEGDQGTDFARSQRQQQVLLAFKDKVISLSTLFNPNRVRELVQTYTDNVKTDLTEPEYLSLAKLALRAKNENFRTGLLQEETEEREGMLVHPNIKDYLGQWVLIGKGDSWEEIHQYVEDLFFKQ
jgi:LCP family protein required for cell wall assembly